MRYNLICCASFWISAKDVINIYPNAKSDIYDYLTYLSTTPGSGDPVPGYEGKVFKERWGLKSYRIGKPGGLRVYYYYRDNLIAPFFIYSKKQREDAEREVIRKIVSLIEQEIN